MPHAATVTWLKAASAILTAVGLVIALASMPALGGPTRILLDLVFWPYDGQPGLASPEARLLCAISGGLMAG